MDSISRWVDLGELLIEPGIDPSVSEVMDFSGWRGSCSQIQIDGPGTLTGAVKVQVSNSLVDSDVYGTTWRDMQSAGSDITIPADGSVTIQAVNFSRLRLVSAGSEVAPRRFRIRGLSQ